MRKTIRPCILKKLFSVIACLTFLPSIALSHNPEFSYIWLQVNEDSMVGRIEASTLHINAATDLDLSIESGLSEDDQAALKTYFGSHFSVGDSNGPYSLTFNEIDVLEEGLQYIVMRFTLEAPQPAPDELTISYSAIMHAIPEHRGGFHFENNYKTGLVGNHMSLAYIHAPGRETVDLSLLGPNRLKEFVGSIREGIEHIWIGIDHVLFLVTLLLTAVLIRKERNWRPADNLKAATWNVVAIVTVFTIAHSITLAMAMKGWVSLPSRFVESVIALSILIVVIDNFFSFLGRYKWSTVFIFGLFHGLGFASVLSELTFDLQSRVLALIGFNIGVELGQLVIVFVVFPVLFLLRDRHYVNRILRPVSGLIGVIACWWLVERAFDLPSFWSSF